MKKVDLDTLYQEYALDRTPDRLTPVVKALEPSINYAVSSIGAGDDKLVRHKARIIAGMAVERYSPEHGANLKTWVGNQLMQVRRFRRETQQPIKIPERTQLDAYTLHKSEQKFIDQYDREPDVKELADFSKLPVKRIEKIRRSQRVMPSETVVNAIGGTEHSAPDTALEALEYIYDESDKQDRSIIEMKTGFGGKYEPMQPKDIAFKLGMTPSQLSRRSARLSYKLQQYESALDKVI